MTSGFRNSAGVDFDSLFDPYVQGTKPANTGFRTADGVDLANRYAPIVWGTKGPDVNYRTSGGLDLSNLWAAAGTAHYVPVIPFGSYTSIMINSHDAGSTFVCAFNSNGSWGITQTNVPGPGTTGGTPTSGQWAPSITAGIGSSYNIRVTASISVTNTAGGSPTYTASTGFVALDSGFTITIATGHIINTGLGGICSLNGHYTIDIQAKSGGPITTSTLTIIEVEADLS